MYQPGPSEWTRNEQGAGNRTKASGDWRGVASVWQNAETEPGRWMYDYGEADQGRCNWGIRSSRKDPEANSGWMFMQAVGDRDDKCGRVETKYQSRWSKIGRIDARML
ncbi:hypothetical protein P3342_006278 [Pyrenophora teres f. teres]|nr:hypothetical protein P3342_006278 [Pyrenophora teres f. teres]